MDSFLRKSFNTQLDLLSKVFLQPACKSNPSNFMYKKKARTILFRLEALSRICRSIYTRKVFNNFYDDFKLLEDGLGSIEHFDELLSFYLHNKQLPKSFLNYFSRKKELKCKELDQTVREKSFCSATYFRELSLKLDAVKWKDADGERQAFIEFLINQFDRISDDLDDGNLNFSDIEIGLHEFRRKIRWLSIYASVVDGVIQLRKTQVPNSLLTHYLSPEIINLPYNKFAPTPRGVKPVFIQSQNFYALSWIINELGNLKDEGLRRVEIELALKESLVTKKKELRKLLLKNLRTLNALCETGENLADDFIYKNRVFKRIIRDLKQAIPSSEK